MKDLSKTLNVLHGLGVHTLLQLQTLVFCCEPKTTVEICEYLGCSRQSIVKLHRQLPHVLTMRYVKMTDSPTDGRKQALYETNSWVKKLITE